MKRMIVLAGALCAGAEAGAAVMQVVVVDRDNIELTGSSVVEVPEGLVIEDSDGNGVIHIRTGGITVEFAPGSVLRGAAEGHGAWDSLAGTGIRIEGAADVSLVGARVHGYKVGVHATDADGLVVDGADLSDNFRQRLASTAEREDVADWLFPHHNDEHEWITRWGAALCIEGSDGVLVRGVWVRHGQNGIVLDRVNGAEVYDNDCSFLSGWGIAMWRSSDNMISRNAVDYCIRGHSEGVYNRGQDSAGILMFEQCSRNIIIENSATHCGDGVFGFAGREAIGETDEPEDLEFRYGDAGCNDNVFLGNDLSYASAHGLEMTFSERNIIAGNTFAGNAICGIWGGYSSDTQIVGNTFTDNGGMAYGLERGGINIEHGSRNIILGNSFVNNRCAVSLWWDADGLDEKLAGVREGYAGVSRNVVAGNVIRADAQHGFGEGAQLVGLEVRSGGSGQVFGNTEFGNSFDMAAPASIARRIDAGAEFSGIASGVVVGVDVPEVRAIGERRPVGARAAWDRKFIVMTEWGPWDHEELMVRRVGSSGASQKFEVRTRMHQGPTVSVEGEGVELRLKDGEYEVFAPGGGVRAFVLKCSDGRSTVSVPGLLVSAGWEVSHWTLAHDPLVDRAPLAERMPGADEVVVYSVGELDLPFGMEGPRAPGGDGVGGEPVGIGPDHFATLVRASVDLPVGRWRLRVLSDDGVRVYRDGVMIFERWDVHGPTEDVVEFGVAEGDGAVELRVEHFERDGYAVLRAGLERVVD